MSDTFLRSACFSVPPVHQAAMRDALTELLGTGEGPDPQPFATLSEGLAALGFAPFTDADGNLAVCHLDSIEARRFGDDLFYAAIAPFLADGSYFEVDYDRWYYRVYVRDGQYEWVEAELHFDVGGSLALISNCLREHLTEVVHSSAPPVPANCPAV